MRPESLVFETMGKKFDLEAMSTDEMWQLHVEIGRLLSVRLTTEKRELEKRLAQLRREKARRVRTAISQTRVPRIGTSDARRGH